MENMRGKVVEGQILFAYREDVPQEEIKTMEEIIRKVIKNSQKPRCKACVPCPMGVVGCDWDDKPHGHGSAKRCPECGVLYYNIHPHSNSCSMATPITDDVRHDEQNIRRQFRESDIEKKWKDANTG